MDSDSIVKDILYHYDEDAIINYINTEASFLMGRTIKSITVCDGLELLAKQTIITAIYFKMNKYLVTNGKHRKLNKITYEHYLNRPEWRARRTLVKMFSGYKCQLCGKLPPNDTDNHLVVHHNTYERKGHELLTDLIVLCNTCHNEYHSRKFEKKRNIRNIAKAMLSWDGEL